MSTETGQKSAHYVHGTSPEEQRRLSLLNELLNQSCARELDLQGGERILDVGSGLGQFARIMARAAGRNGANGAAVGVERDEQQLAEARRQASSANEEQLVDFRQGDALELPLRSDEWGQFDVAHTRFVLEHIPKPIRVVEQMVRAVRPGGRVVVSDDDHDNFRPWPEPEGFHALWQAYIRSYDRAGNDPFIGRRLVSLLHDAGLKAIRNTCVFFGSCAHDDTFPLVVDNIIGVLAGARHDVLDGEFLDEASFDMALRGLARWKQHPSAALWYSLSWAEGTVPG